MTIIEKIEKAVKNLPTQELAEFRAWFAEFDAAVWDEQFETDVKAGRLDKIAEKAKADFRKGKCREL